MEFRFTNKPFLLFIFLFILLSNAAFSQSHLQKRMSINAENQSIKSILNTIEEKGKFYFSYNSDLLQEERITSIHANNNTVEEILQQVLGSGYKFQISDKHIIIKLATGQGIIFSGKLIEAETGLPIEYASIYEKSLMAGTTTDANGNFKLQIKQHLPSYELVITKLSYNDTVLRLEKTYQTTEPIKLKRNFSELEEVTVLGVEQHWLAKRLINTKTKFNSINLKGYFSKQPYQFSLLPGLGSKNHLKSQTINKFSFNLVGGYTAGVRGFELGTAFNIVQNDMEYAQIGGFFNIVGGKSNGVQIAGVYNYVAKAANGVQVSGVYNNALSLEGVQASGILNWNRTITRGVQMTGVLNKSGATKGAQFSGLANWNNHNLDGFQAAGALNINDSVRGVQCAGLLNYTKKQTNGLQIAGAANITRKTHNGSQIAGLFNYTKVIRGTQIALINIADSSSGVSLGLINIIFKGKHSIDFNTTDWQPYSLLFKSGNHSFYNIFQIGGNPHKGQKLLSIGYGIGGGIQLHKNFELVQETILNTIHVGNWNDQNILGRYQIMLQYQLYPNIKIYAGPAINILYHENSNTYEGFGVPFQTNYPSLKIDNNVKAWIGWTFGVSLF